MNEGLEKFAELMKTDEEFQNKLKTAAEAYSGDKNDVKAFFEAVLVPLGQEYGISATYEEFSNYIEARANTEISPEEIKQVAGGKSGNGFGIGACYRVGVGIGYTGNDERSNTCMVLGSGDTAGTCAGSGSVA